MTKKNAVYKVDNGQGGFDEIMFKTISEQVFFDDGNTLKDKFNIKDGLLWRGYHHMSKKELVYPSKKLSECQHGWVLVWSDWDDDGSKGQDWNYVYSYVPKNSEMVKRGANTCFPLSTGEGDDGFANKTLYFFDDHFTGHDNNKSGSAWDIVLRQVLEF